MNDDNIMPLGKHKGESFANIPVEYLDWLIGQDWLQSGLKKEIFDHLETRQEWLQMGDDE